MHSVTIPSRIGGFARHLKREFARKVAKTQRCGDNDIHSCVTNTLRHFSLIQFSMNVTSMNENELSKVIVDCQFSRSTQHFRPRPSGVGLRSNLGDVSFEIEDCSVERQVAVSD